MSAARMLMVVCVQLALAGCASQGAVKVRCDGRLVPINAAAATPDKVRMAPLEDPAVGALDMPESSRDPEVHRGE